MEDLNLLLEEIMRSEVTTVEEAQRQSRQFQKELEDYREVHKDSFVPANQLTSEQRKNINKALGYLT